MGRLAWHGIAALYSPQASLSSILHSKLLHGSVSCTKATRVSSVESMETLPNQYCESHDPHEWSAVHRSMFFADGRWWKQLIPYLVSIVFMKLVVLLPLTLPGISGSLISFGHSLLEYLSPSIQVIFVMAVFPLIMNVIQFCLVDQVIKANTGKDGEGRNGRDWGLGSTVYNLDEEAGYSLLPRAGGEGGDDPHGSVKELDVDAESSSVYHPAQPTASGGQLMRRGSSSSAIGPPSARGSFDHQGMRSLRGGGSGRRHLDVGRKEGECAASGGDDSD